MSKDITPWLDTIENISRSVAYDYPCVEKDDVYQHLCLMILQEQSLSNPDQEGVVGTLFKIAKRYAKQQRVEALHISVQYAYRPSDVRKILETLFEYTEWMDGWVPEDAESIKDSADSLDLHSDVSWAFSQLQKPQKEILYRRYGLREDLDNSDRVRLSRATDKLVEVLNTYRRPGHRRKAMTNAASNATIGRQTDG